MKFIIHPYVYLGCWVFDEPKLGLDKEMFVRGADAIIAYISKQRGIEYPEDGVEIEFSTDSIDPSDFAITYTRSENGGSWYRLDGTNMDGWLCPALLKFFPYAPTKIYINVRPASQQKQMQIAVERSRAIRMPQVMQ